jgi:MerR family transcriptional regulator/heat shock protein HspR
MAGAYESGSPLDEHAAVFVISVAAELAGMHPQTLRQYDRLGLVSPGRTSGRGRRYSARDIAQLREVQRLSQEEGVNLAGVKRIMELENQVDALRARLAVVEADLREVTRASAVPSRRLFSAGAAGEIVTVPLGRRPFGDPSTALVVWRPQR